uniref:Uncharacterized protein n=1 Tax=Micrurus corallinus TaxID=54390 RepID=A0A2D4G5K5_MICCO
MKEYTIQFYQPVAIYLFILYCSVSQPVGRERGWGREGLKNYYYLNLELSLVGLWAQKVYIKGICGEEKVEKHCFTVLGNKEISVNRCLLTMLSSNLKIISLTEKWGSRLFPLSPPEKDILNTLKHI